MHQLIRLGLWIVSPTEKFLLVVVTRTPRKHAAYVQLLALDLPRHIFWPHALCWILVVCAACRVNVMISGIPAIFGRIDPPLHLELYASGFPLCHFDSLGLR